MLRPIVLYGAEVLAKPSKPVTHISDAEVQLVKDMVETMYKAPGVGLAAPQVGVGKRIMVTDPTAGENGISSLRLSIRKSPNPKANNWRTKVA
jgi:peptide deformylase